MNRNLVALSTNDYINLSGDNFGQSHYFTVYQLEGDSLIEIETRENVLFMRACDLQGRAEHLHGLLGDISHFIGSGFDPEVKRYLTYRNHNLITVSPEPIETIAERLPDTELKSLQNR